MRALAKRRWKAWEKILYAIYKLIVNQAASTPHPLTPSSLFLSPANERVVWSCKMPFVSVAVVHYFLVICRARFPVSFRFSHFLFARSSRRLSFSLVPLSFSLFDRVI